MVKLAYQYQVDAVSVLLLRMLFSLSLYVFIAIFYRLRNNGVELVRNDYIWLAFVGFIGYYLSSYFDFVAYGSEAKVKEAGKMRVEGKNYVVMDGYVMHFLFNV